MWKWKSVPLSVSTFSSRQLTGYITWYRDRLRYTSEYLRPKIFWRKICKLSCRLYVYTKIQSCGFGEQKYLFIDLPKQIRTVSYDKGIAINTILEWLQVLTITWQWCDLNYNFCTNNVNPYCNISRYFLVCIETYLKASIYFSYSYFQEKLTLYHIAYLSYEQNVHHLYIA